MKKIINLVFSLIVVAGLTSFLYHYTQQAEINYYQGHRLFLNGNYSKAIPYYKNSLKADHRQFKAKKELAYSYFWTDNPKKSIPLFEDISKKNPKNQELKLYLAKAYSRTGSRNKALSIMGKIETKDKQLDIKMTLAEIYIWNNQLTKARELLREVLAQNPSNNKAKFLLAKTFYYDQKSKKASKILENLLEEGKELPENVKEKEVRGLLAQTYISSNQSQRAVELYQQLVDQNPNDIDLKMKLAELLSWTKELERSEDLYRKIIKKSSRKREAYLGLAKVLIGQNRYKEAISIIDKIGKIKGTKNAKLMYGKALLYSGKPKLARDIFAKLLKDYPQDLETKELLADAYAYSKKYKKAILLYRKILVKTDRRKTKKGLAAVLSWNQQYQKSIKLYDQLLAEEYDPEVKRQKARVLGWSKNYQKALAEYKDLLDKEKSSAIRLEMEAKQAYWQGEVKSAINNYQKLLIAEPDNVEAAFDLSQLYSYQDMWEEAINQYENILKVQPLHSRAREGLEKAKIFYKKVKTRLDYLFFEADSPDRTTDIKKHQVLKSASFFIAKNKKIKISSDFAQRSFSDFSSISESKTQLEISYQNNPDWNLSAYYGLVNYYKHLDELFHLFGASFYHRFFDRGMFNFNYQRQRLTDNSQLIRDYAYRHSFENKIDFDLTSKLKMGLDCRLAYYFDANFLVEPGIDFTYYFSKEPRQFYLTYRYFFKEFRKESSDYWTPRGFSTNKLTLAWRHYLNSDQLFFGADQLYYQLKYEVSLDSTDILIHKFIGQFNWDINKSLNIHFGGSFADTTSNVYQEKRITAGLSYYF
ncbi:MAG: tetratricopeptide repeat protein [Candidatus Omnitrophica bacterium]|nr:tetratricopeptide repeat protein [Candidatus Omnitrophota bacterium]MCF7894274.1 tetratricopeptide repeat protein [Candidatus Omnitrophota bacterium]